MDLLDIAQDYWIVVSAFVGIIISWSNLKMQNNEQEKRICKLEQDAKDLNPVLLEIRTKLASIEATLSLLVKERK